MGKKNKLPNPTVAESKAAIDFGVAFLLMSEGGVYAVYHVSSSRAVRSDGNQVPVYFKQAKDRREENPGGSRAAAVLLLLPPHGPSQLARLLHEPAFHELQICVNEARLAGQLHGHGKSAEEIRAAIIAKQWANLGSSKQ